jgi:hypothetical protein
MEFRFRSLWAGGRWPTTPDKLRIDADAGILVGIDNAGLYQGITSCGGDPRSQILLTTES